MRLFLAETKKVLLGLPFIIYFVILLVFHITQYGQEVHLVSPPVPGAESYGMIAKENPEVIIPTAIGNLQWEYEQNTYIAYPFSFYKEVHLNEKQQANMKELMEQLHNEMDYKQFSQVMGEIDTLIGGKSSYEQTNLASNFGRVEKSYEEALAEYQLIKDEDKFSNAYARYFADYTGIILLILPIFIITALSLKDQSAGINALIYSRKISSFKLITTRFFAVIFATIVPVLLLAIYETKRVMLLYPTESLDLFAFIKHVFVWLLPTILVVVAFGFLVTEWSGTILAIVLQFALFFLSLSVGMSQMTGGYSLGLIALRHNIIGNTGLYQAHLQDLWINRISYTVLAFVLLALTVKLYEAKRKGMRTVYERLQDVFNARH